MLFMTKLVTKMSSYNFINIASVLGIDTNGMGVEEVKGYVYDKVDLYKAKIESIEKVRIASEHLADSIKKLERSEFRVKYEEMFDQFRANIRRNFTSMVLKGQWTVKEIEIAVLKMAQASSATTEAAFRGFLEQLKELRVTAWMFS